MTAEQTADLIRALRLMPNAQMPSLSDETMKVAADEIERLWGLVVAYRGAIHSIGSIVSASRELDGSTKISD